MLCVVGIVCVQCQDDDVVSVLLLLLPLNRLVTLAAAYRTDLNTPAVITPKYTETMRLDVDETENDVN